MRTTRKTAQCLPTMHRFEDVATSYGISVRRLKDQVRALRAPRTILGSRWYFTDEQLAGFRKARTVTSGAEPAPDPLAKVRARVANRFPQHRHRASGRSPR